MTKIEELLKNEKVEWKKLGEVCEFINGFAFKSNLFKKIGYPIIRITNIKNGKIIFDDLKYFDEKDYVNLDNYKIFPNDILVAMSGATTGKIGYNYTSNIAYLNQRVGKFVPNISILNNRYLFHFLFSKEKEIYDLSSGTGSQPNLSKSDIEKLLIPIPSLETQEKIVKILDKFTNYVTELQSELQSRTKQYNYYRDKLLSEECLNEISEKIDKFEDKEYELRVTTLGEIGKFTRGNGLQKSDFIDTGKPVIHYGQIYTKYGFETDKTISYVNQEVFSKLRKAKPKDILIATTSENIEDVGKCLVWLGSEEVGFSGDMYSFSTLENSKYIAYYFQTVNFQKQKERKVTGTKLIRIHSEDVEKFKITLPPIEIQNKVVEVLDKFQELLKDTKGLLPKEIEQRKKQYEYYREKLLTFDEKCGNTHTHTHNNS